MPKLIVLLGLCSLVLMSCSPETPEMQPVAPPAEEPVKVSAGPYSVVFDPSTNTYTHRFFINIDQNEGKVEYYISAGVSEDITIETAQSGVYGCPATQVSHQMFWAYDQLEPLQGRFVFVGSVVRAYAGYKGILTHTFRKLQGCRSLELTMKLRK